jgi:chromosome segregation ATPase
VAEEHVYDTQISISSLNPDGLLTYIRNKSIGDAARRQLQQIADLKTQIASADAEKRSVTDQAGNLTRDEERNRQNITSLSSVSGQQQLVQEYARKLSDQETQIAKLRDREGALDQQHASLQTQLNGLIEKLDF